MYVHIYLYLYVCMYVGRYLTLISTYLFIYVSVISIYQSWYLSSIYAFIIYVSTVYPTGFLSWMGPWLAWEVWLFWINSGPISLLQGKQHVAPQLCGLTGVCDRQWSPFPHSTASHWRTMGSSMWCDPLKKAQKTELWLWELPHLISDPCHSASP